jgi:hypothetical protein
MLVHLDWCVPILDMVAGMGTHQVLASIAHRFYILTLSRPDSMVIIT